MGILVRWDHLGARVRRAIRGRRGLLVLRGYPVTEGQQGQSVLKVSVAQSGLEEFRGLWGRLERWVQWVQWVPMGILVLRVQLGREEALAIRV